MADVPLTKIFTKGNILGHLLQVSWQKISEIVGVGTLTIPESLASIPVTNGP